MNAGRLIDVQPAETDRSQVVQLFLHAPYQRATKLIYT